MQILRDLAERMNRFEKETRRILASHETSSARIITIEQTYADLDGLSINQDSLLRQAFRCIENECYRAATVLAWAAFIDYLEERLAADGFILLSKKRPNWHVKTIDDLRERSSDYQLLEACCDMSLYPKSVLKSLKGLLAKRNECAHPSDFICGLNESLGYVSEVVTRIKKLQNSRTT